MQITCLGGTNLAASEIRELIQCVCSAPLLPSRVTRELETSVREDGIAKEGDVPKCEKL